MRPFRLFVLCFVALVVLAAPGLPAARADGGVNTGEAGSTCASTDGGLSYVPPTNGEFTHGLGTDAPAYYEVGLPTGAYAGQHAKGIMLVIHGGAWYLVGKATVRYERARAEPWRAKGWMTVNIDYRACKQSFQDVLWFMRRLRQIAPDAVICAQGASAGGHLALLLAAVRSDLACAIALGGPSDLGALPYQTSYDPGLKSQSTVGSTRLYNFAVAAFGSGSALTKASPVTYAGRMHARLLLASGATDPLVPAAQNSNFGGTVEGVNPSMYVDVDLLPTGNSKFVHTGVSAAALADLDAREDALVAPLVG
jgi:acetyl esterase/lipase